MIVCFFDFETTSQYADQARIVEVGALTVDLSRGVILDIYSTLVTRTKVDPECYYLKTSGLTVDDLTTRGEPIEEALRNLYARMITCDAIAGHNSTQYDAPLLMNELANLNLSASVWVNPFIAFLSRIPHLDTRFDFPSRGSDKLSYKALDYGHVPYGAHRAIFDCVSSYEIAARSDWPKAIARAAHPFITVTAVSTFDQKDVVKELGYYWEKPNWKKRIRSCDFEDESAKAIAQGFSISEQQRLEEIKTP